MATYYINADTGVNSGAGGSGAPWLTLAYAITNSIANDTIYCQNAVAKYAFVNQSITFRTIQGQSTAGVVFDGAGASVGWTCGATSVDIVTINNITFQNVVRTASVPIIAFSTTAGVTLIVNNCVFHNIETYDDGGSQTSGVLGGAGNIAYWTLTVTGCLFYDIRKYATSLAGYIFGIRAYQYSIANLATTTFTNCTIYQSATGSNAESYIFGIRDNSGTPNTQVRIYVKNCIIHNASGATLNLYLHAFGGAGSWFITYSDLYLVTSGVALGTGSITTNPLLVDPTLANFELQLGSPAIGGGTLT